MAGRLLDAGPPQQRVVLAALLIDAGRPVMSNTLIDRVWDGTPPAAARQALYAHIARIRRILDHAAPGDSGPPVALVRRSSGYLLQVAPEQVDLHRFTALATAAHDPRRADADRARVLRQALDLWRGTALADLSGDWAARARDHLHHQRLDVAVAWAHAELQLGHHQQVIDPIRGLLADYPLSEPLVAVLIRALAAAGRDAEALRVYATTRARFIDELGTEPGPDLRATHQAVLRGEHHTTNVVTTNLSLSRSPDTRPEVASATGKDVLMPAPHLPELRCRAVELARLGERPVAMLARSLSVSESCLRGWMAQADTDETGSDARLTSAEKRELAQLRRDKRRLEMENEILKRAAACFARENVLPH
ncbi:MAG TPA: BTAD domain-containing putative transcriptional regulator [Mycobacteriales bacterium]|nr:BTAD domain-containing putative transcriptional regulator [Mycobacteriales bacterium]